MNIRDEQERKIKRNTRILEAVVFLLLVATVLNQWPRSADADQSYYVGTQMTQAMVHCNFEAATNQRVAVSATSAATPSATGRGTVRLVCNTDAHFQQAAFGATGVTATTGGPLLPKNTPEYVYSRGSLFGFVQDSAGGFCWVTECM